MEIVRLRLRHSRGARPTEATSTRRRGDHRRTASGSRRRCAQSWSHPAERSPTRTHPRPEARVRLLSLTGLILPRPITCWEWQRTRRAQKARAASRSSYRTDTRPTRNTVCKMDGVLLGPAAKSNRRAPVHPLDVAGNDINPPSRTLTGGPPAPRSRASASRCAPT